MVTKCFSGPEQYVVHFSADVQEQVRHRAKADSWCKRPKTLSIVEWVQIMLKQYQTFNYFTKLCKW